MKPAAALLSPFLATLLSRFCSLLSKCVEACSEFVEGLHTCDITTLLGKKNLLATKRDALFFIQ